MTRFMFFAPRAGLLLTALSTIVFLAGGCDRFMAFRVHAYVLDAKGQPLPGEIVGIISHHPSRWPCIPRGDEATPTIGMAKYADVYKTEPNGLITFDISSSESMGMLDWVVDPFFPPSVKFLIILRYRQPSAYAVRFVPGGDYRKDRLTYQHFDVESGRTLKTTYSDASGGLDIAIHRPPRDPNNPWSTPRPSLDIRVLTREDTSQEQALPSDK